MECSSILRCGHPLTDPIRLKQSWRRVATVRTLQEHHQSAYTTVPQGIVPGFRLSFKVLDMARAPTLDLPALLMRSAATSRAGL